MTEQEYINARDLEKVSAAKTILSTLIPETSEVININDFNVVMEKISKWEAELYAEIEIKND